MDLYISRSYELAHISLRNDQLQFITQIFFNVKYVKSIENSDDSTQHFVFKRNAYTESLIHLYISLWSITIKYMSR